MAHGALQDPVRVKSFRLAPLAKHRLAKTMNGVQGGSRSSRLASTG